MRSGNRSLGIFARWRSMMAVVAMLAFSLPGPAPADSTGLVRLTDRDDLLGWEAVGRLDIDGTGYCTGTLIAPDLVLTAAHCVYDRESRWLHLPETLTFRAGLRDGVSIAERRVARIAVPPEYDPRAAPGIERVRHDVALLRLARPITSRVADPFILFRGPRVGAQVSVTSYGRGRDEAPSRQRRCSVVAKADGLMAFDCDVTYGSSGAPVFVQSGPRGRIVSVISGGGTVAGREVALGMALPETVARLRARLRAAPRPATARINRLGAGARSRSTGAKFIRNHGAPRTP